MQTDSENPNANENQQTPDNSTDNAVVKEVKGLTKIMNDFISVFKKAEPEPPKDTPKEPTNSGSEVNKELEKMKGEFQKQLDKNNEEWLKKFTELEQKREAEQKEKELKLIQKEIVKAKEIGFIKPDDKAKEKWLENALIMDFDNTQEMIKDFSNSKNHKPSLEPKVQETLAKQIAKQTISSAFY